MFIRVLRPGHAPRPLPPHFKLADIGEGITECEAIRWAFAPATAMCALDALCEVQNDKANVEFTSPVDVVVRALLVQEGAIARVAEGLSFTPAAGADSTLALVTSAVRNYARTPGVDPTLVAPGRGRGGRVEKADVDGLPRFLLSLFPGLPIPTPILRRRYHRRAWPHSFEIPTFGYTAALDITDLHAPLPLLTAHIPAQYRPSASFPEVGPRTCPGRGLIPEVPVPQTAHYAPLMYLPILIKALARAMMKPTLTIRPHADLALALATSTGLHTALLRAAETRSVYALASEVAWLAELGRRGRRDVTIGRAEWVRDVSAVYWGDDSQTRGARRPKVPISWSADHQVVEGAAMAAFVECGWSVPGGWWGRGVGR
ncbi:hypothetical protein DFH09DRAFT_1458785 [Mycena vulgaris]|nr:hypothetical protein DFH09DRAFT_1458785 [Mycena vulgaris]